MSKKDRISRMSFDCPNCHRGLYTRNKRPKCYWCGAALRVEDNQDRIIVLLRKNGNGNGNTNGKINFN